MTFRILVLFLFLIFGFFNSFSAINISSCSDSINVNNEYYTLNQSLGPQDWSCLVPQANHSTIDCQGFSIIGDYDSDGNGINGNGGSSSENLTVKNCIIEGFYAGIYIQNIDYIIFENMTLRNNAENGLAVSIWQNNLKIINSRLYNNSVGFNVHGSNKNISIQNSQIYDNDYGVYLKDLHTSSTNNENITIIGNDIRGNNLYSIYLNNSGEDIILISENYLDNVFDDDWDTVNRGPASYNTSQVGNYWSSFGTCSQTASTTLNSCTYTYCTQGFVLNSTYGVNDSLPIISTSGSGCLAIVGPVTQTEASVFPSFALYSFLFLLFLIFTRW